MQLFSMPVSEDLAQDRHAIRAVAARRCDRVEGVNKFTGHVAAQLDERVRHLSHLRSEHFPGDVSAQIFAAHLAAGGPFDGRAILCRHVPALLPHGDVALADANELGELLLAADDFDGLEKCFHGLPFKHERVCQVNTKVLDAQPLITFVKTAKQDWSTLAARMKWARERKGWSQGTLAKKSGVGQSAIGNIEAGERHKPREILEMAAALEVYPRWLGLGEGEPDNRGQPILRDDVLEFAKSLQKMKPEQVRNLSITMTAFGPAVPDERVEEAFRHDSDTPAGGPAVRTRPRPAARKKKG